MNDLRAIRTLMQEIAADRPSVLDGTVSCAFCAALVLNENHIRHLTWHDSVVKAPATKGSTP